MKKTISIILSILISISALSPCYTAIAAEIRMNDAIAVSNNIAEMTEAYNEEYKDKLEVSGASSIIVDNRIIVETKSKINTYNAVDEVYGLGYAFVQFETTQEAENAIKQYEYQGLTVENDKIYNLNATSSSSSNDERWAYKFSEADTTVNYFNNNNSNLSEIIVATIDTGIKYDHGDLKDRIIRTYADFSIKHPMYNEDDYDGHGTNVAGVIAQCTPSNVKIEAFKVAEYDGTVYTSALICAYEYILAMNDNVPDVINMSYGGYREAQPIEKRLLGELKQKGIVLVASAGNENTDTKNINPANDDNVIAVSAYDESGNKCWFSNYGSTVDIAAPGINVYTTFGIEYTSDFSGTSAAAPFVSSAAAIILMQNDTLTPDEVRIKLKESAFKRKIPSDKMWAGAGLLNFSNLIEGERKSDVEFNYESGEYQDTIKVQLSCPDKLNTKIIYTTDNTLPSSTNGKTYTTPITVNTQAHIIAAAFPIIGTALHSQYTSGDYQVFKEASENDFVISDDGNITGYTGEYFAFKVPDTINGIIPTSIGDNCFNSSSITHIELPDSVTVINESAFENSSLEKIVANGIDIVWQSGFENCYSLYEEKMPNITKLDDSAFLNCQMLTNLSFKDNLVHAYCNNDYVNSRGCLSGTGITEADFPNLVTCGKAFENTPIIYANLPKVKFLNGAFRDCSILSSVNIPLVTKVGNAAFANCPLLPNDMDFSNITEVSYHGFEDSLFDSIYLPNCTMLWGKAFYNSRAKTINIPNCTTLGGEDFSGSYLESVNIENAETINSAISGEFVNCFSLKGVYAPKLKQIPSFTIDSNGDYEINIEGVVPALEYIYTPVATKFSYSYTLLEEFVNLKILYAPMLEDIARFAEFPRSDNFTIYLSSAFNTSYLASSIVNGKYTIVAPSGSGAEAWANYKGNQFVFLSSDSKTDGTDSSNVNTVGRSICTSVAGIRFGFTWDNIDEIESLASNVEYGFIYSQKGAEDLTIDTVDSSTVKKALAPNRIEKDGTTSFNLVISNIPTAYYDREITARAYVCIDGMYFYSNTLKGSFGEVAGLVLADDEIDENTKNAVNRLLEA